MLLRGALPARAPAEAGRAKDLYAGDGILMFWSHEPIPPEQTPKLARGHARTLRPNPYLRMIENRFVTTESSFVDMDAWDACCDPEMVRMVSATARFAGVRRCRRSR